MKIAELFLQEEDKDISNRNLTSLEKFNIQSIVNGNFYCSNNKLTSLQYCPTKINGSFSCSRNQLTSLQYCPSEVNGNFYCNDNQLTSLQYCPSEVKGHFSCYKNRLTSLQYCPSKINGHFSCNDNQLTSLQYGPSKVNGNFYCINNKLSSLKDIHKLFKNDGYIKGNIAFYDNPIKSHILGLMLIPGLKSIDDIENIKDEQLKLACTIINKHLSSGNRDLFACQEELIDNNLKDFAEL